VAGVAGERGVSADQREAVRVLLHGRDGYGPAAHRVALLAAVPHLAAMEIGVTVGAARTNLAENETDVATAASHRLVHATQGKAGLGVVIELGGRTDWLPAGGVVAVFAGDAERTVRIGGPAARGRLGRDG